MPTTADLCVHCQRQLDHSQVGYRSTGIRNANGRYHLTCALIVIFKGCQMPPEDRKKSA